KQKDKTKLQKLFDENYFENFKSKKIENSNGKIFAQVINSSPLYLSQKIEDSFIFLINFAKKSIVIETPYLICDDKFFCALKNAAMSGVDVKIILSKKPDKMFVYNASLYYAKILSENGINIFLFDGFVHSKTMLVDEDIFVCGSANFDMRSFNLNFETSVVVYSKKLTKKFENMIFETLKNCVKLDVGFYKKLPVTKKLAIKFSKLFSPIL
ncbi:MAG: phospholipase D-like domain-containing protein, partial [Christensenellales bacterium]